MPVNLRKALVTIVVVTAAVTGITMANEATAQQNQRFDTTFSQLTGNVKG